MIACLEDFIENARLFIFETFCRIHQCISIKMLAEKLNMTPEEAERWIVNLIRNARLDAKIDSKQVGFVFFMYANIQVYSSFFSLCRFSLFLIYFFKNIFNRDIDYQTYP